MRKIAFSQRTGQLRRSALSALCRELKTDEKLRNSIVNVLQNDEDSQMRGSVIAIIASNIDLFENGMELPKRAHEAHPEDFNFNKHAIKLLGV